MNAADIVKEANARMEDLKAEIHVLAKMLGTPTIADGGVDAHVNDEWYVPGVERLLGKELLYRIYGEVESNTLNKPAMLSDIGIARAIASSYTVGYRYKLGSEGVAKPVLRDATALFAAAFAKNRLPEVCRTFGDVTKLPWYIIAHGMMQRVLAQACTLES